MTTNFEYSMYPQQCDSLLNDPLMSPRTVGSSKSSWIQSPFTQYASQIASPTATNMSLPLGSPPMYTSALSTPDQSLRKMASNITAAVATMQRNTNVYRVAAPAPIPNVVQSTRSSTKDNGLAYNAPKSALSIKNLPPSRNSPTQSPTEDDILRCNCKKSKCLKLYCQCFANKRYCEGAICKCNECNNLPQYEEVRQDAIRQTIERNSTAFVTKVSDEKSNINGCTCKKSQCLKKYCECFEANAFCGDNCKCASCQNFSGSVALASKKSNIPAVTTGNSVGMSMETIKYGKHAGRSNYNSLNASYSSNNNSMNTTADDISSPTTSNSNNNTMLLPSFTSYLATAQNMLPANNNKRSPSNGNSSNNTKSGSDHTGNKRRSSSLSSAYSSHHSNASVNTTCVEDTDEDVYMLNTSPLKGDINDSLLSTVNRTARLAMHDQSSIMNNSNLSHSYMSNGGSNRSMSGNANSSHHPLDVAVMYEVNLAMEDDPLLQNSRRIYFEDSIKKQLNNANQHNTRGRSSSGSNIHTNPAYPQQQKQSSYITYPYDMRSTGDTYNHGNYLDVKLKHRNGEINSVGYLSANQSFTNNDTTIIGSAYDECNISNITANSNSSTSSNKRRLVYIDGEEIVVSKIPTWATSSGSNTGVLSALPSPVSRTSSSNSSSCDIDVNTSSISNISVLPTPKRNNEPTSNDNHVTDPTTFHNNTNCIDSNSVVRTPYKLRTGKRDAPSSINSITRIGNSSNIVISDTAMGSAIARQNESNNAAIIAASPSLTTTIIPTVLLSPQLVIPRGINQLSGSSRITFTPLPMIVYPFFGTQNPKISKVLALCVLEYLSDRDIYCISLINRLWNCVAFDEALWEC